MRRQSSGILLSVFLLYSHWGICSPALSDMPLPIQQLVNKDFNRGVYLGYFKGEHNITTLKRRFCRFLQYSSSKVTGTEFPPIDSFDTEDIKTSYDKDKEITGCGLTSCFGLGVSRDLPATLDSRALSVSAIPAGGMEFLTIGDTSTVKGKVRVPLTEVYRTNDPSKKKYNSYNKIVKCFAFMIGGLESFKYEKEYFYVGKLKTGISRVNCLVLVFDDVDYYLIIDNWSIHGTKQ